MSRRKVVPNKGVTRPKVTSLMLSRLALCVIAGIGGYESLYGYNRVECPGGFGRVEGHHQILGPGGLKDQALELSTKYAMYVAKRDHGLLDIPPPTDRVYCAGHAWADAVGVYCEPAPPLTVVPISQEEKDAIADFKAQLDAKVAALTAHADEQRDELADLVPVYARKDGEKTLAGVADKAMEGRDYAIA